MTTPVEIEFVARGQREILAAFDTIEARMAKMEGAATSATRGGSSARVKASEQESERRGRAMSATAKLAERVERDQLRAAEQAERAKMLAVEKTEKWKENVRRQSALMAGRLAEQQANKEIHEAERAAKASHAVRERYSRMVGGAVTRGVGNVVSAGANLVGMAMTLGGGFAVADSVSRSMGASRAAVGLQNSALIAGTNISKEAILGRAGVVQRSTGVDKADLIKGWSEYVKLSSDVKGGGDNLEGLAKLSKGTGTDFSEMMTLAGRLKVQNKNLGNDDMMAIIRNVIGQGGMGDLEIENLAKYGGKITSTSGQYSGKQAVNQQRLLGLAQVAGIVNDPAEAATAVQRFSSDISTNADKINAHLGVKVKDKTGGLRDPAEIIAEMMKASGGDVGKLAKAGVGKDAMALFNAERSIYNDAGGGQKGADAVKAHIAARENAGLSEDKAEELFGNVHKEDSEKLHDAMQQLEDAVAKSATPAIGRLADKLPDLIPKIEAVITSVGHFAEWFADNPIKGIGAVVLASISKELLTAGIGNAIKTALVPPTPGGAGVPTPGAGPGAGGGSAVIPIALAGALAIGATYDTMTSALSGQEAGQRRVGELRALTKGGVGDIPDLTGTFTGNQNAKETLDSEASRNDKVRREREDAKRRTGALGILGLISGAGLAAADVAYGAVTKTAGLETHQNEGVSNLFGGDTFATSVKKFTAALEIKKEADGVKKNMDTASTAIAKFSKALGSIHWPGGKADPSDPTRNGPPTQ